MKIKNIIIICIVFICLVSFVSADLNSATPQISISKAGETTRNSTNCAITSSNGDWASYNCSIPMYFYDGAGAWSINASIKEPPCTRTLNNGENLTFAIVNSTAGEVICLNSGTYLLPTISIHKPLTIRSTIEKTYPKIVATSGTYAINIYNGNFTFQGVEINASTTSIYPVRFYNGTNILVYDCRIKDGGRGLWFEPTVANQTLEFKVLNSEFVNTRKAAIVVGGGRGGFLIKNNWIHDTLLADGQTMGIQLYRDTFGVNGASTMNNTAEISYNYIAGVRAGIAFTPGTTNSTVPIAGNLLIKHNTIDYTWNNISKTYQGISLWDMYSISYNSSAITIKDNIITNIRDYGIYSGDYNNITNISTTKGLLGNLDLSNNLLWNNGWSGAANVYPEKWFGNNGNVSPYAQVCWTFNGSDFITTSSQVMNPLFVASARTTPQEYYRLSGCSPACNAATDGTNIGASQMACNTCNPSNNNTGANVSLNVISSISGINVIQPPAMNLVSASITNAYISFNVTNYAGDYILYGNSKNLTVNALDSIALNANAIDFGLVSSNTANVPGTTEVINNTGNQNYATIRLTGYDLSSGMNTITSPNFCGANASNPAMCNYLINNAAVTIPGLILNKGPISQTSVYHYANIPLTPSGAYTSNNNWIYTCS